jgi:DNA-binding SARP family transcriptional activator
MPGVELEALLQPGAASEKNAPLDIRRTLYRSRLPRIDIVTLGGLTVFRGGREPIEDAQWSGNRPKLLLKAIVVHGCRDIPKDILIDDLWPDSDGDAAAKSFKVTLHRLRKVLEPGLSREIGSAYLHLKDNLVSLDRELCGVDVEAFLAKAKEVRKMSNRASASSLLARCAEAAALYGGDFLPEEPYLPWVEMKRTALRDQYVEILQKMADLYGVQNRLNQAADCCKQILQVDPSSDPACQRLMEIYQRQGMRTAAMKVYEAFRSHLISDIGVEPDPETTAIYRSLQHGT